MYRALNQSLARSIDCLCSCHRLGRAARFSDNFSQANYGQTSDMDSTVLELFPKALIGFSLANAEQYKNYLLQACKIHRKHGIRKSNILDPLLQHSQSDPEIQGLHPEAMSIMKDFIADNCSTIVSHINEILGFQPGTDSWLNELKTGRHQLKHSHSLSYYSCIYFFDLPEGSPGTVFYRPMSSVTDAKIEVRTRLVILITAIGKKLTVMRVQWSCSQAVWSMRCAVARINKEYAVALLVTLSLDT